MPVKMPNTVKNVKPGQRLSVKSSGNNSKPSSDLRRLLSLLEKPIPIQEVAAVSHNKAHSTGVKSQGTHHRKDASFKSDSNSNTSSEAHELEKFSITYRNQRCFASHPLHTIFSAILTSLVKNRLCREWINHAPPDSVLQVLICLRLLIRDPQYQIILHQLQGVNLLARYLESVSTMYIEHGDQPFAIQKLVTMTYMFQKLSAVEGQKCWVISSGAHMTLVNLLSTTDSSVLLGSLLALTTLAESPEYKEKIGELPIVEHLLVILQEYDLLSKRMGAELLRHLSPVGRVREQVRELEGLPVLLSLLQGQHLKLLWSVAWVVVQLCEEPDTRAEIRTWGGVRQLLRLLSSDRHFVSDRSSVEALSSANAAGRIQREHVREDLSPQEELDNSMALQSACCAALTELVLDDTAAYQVVQENGIYVIAKLILPQTTGPTAVSLQWYAFRTLRFLFSVQRNRHLFKRIFPMDLFELFIDIGHYVRDLTVYEVLQTKVSLYTAEEMHSLRDGIQALDQNRPPLKVISGYSILNHLGTGAFGSVFKVSKQSGQNLLALKEVNLHNPVFGKDKKSRDSNVDKIVSELTIIKEQMAHPNVVKYYKTFLEGDSLYIVMELIEGVPLADHMSSLKDKQQKFTENRIWNIFVQMCLALRYLHKEKRIVHRDLTPNNIMLGERDKVTITDFGLAKQKQENSKLTSVVGTILYSCPEVVKNEPYGEKADIWAIGCILYQMATLQPPFYSSNMLSLATKIVNAVYEPVEEGTFSERVTDMIKWCLSSDADMRPDIVAVSSRISDIMMRLMDSLYVSQNALERRADRDRQRAQKYFLERHRCGTSCHHPNMAHVLENKTESVFPLSTVSKQNNNQDDNSNDDPAPSTTKINTTASLIKLYEPFDSDACTIPEQLLSMSAYAGPKMKTRPVSAGICVSQKKVRQIDDPIQRLLAQLHKIIFITQLPPASHHDIKRRLIERFKKSLFQYGSNPFNLKVELSKLLQASTELMDLGSQSSDWWPMVHSFAADTSFTHKLDEGGDRHLKDGITYQQMQGILEEVLEKNRYYNIQD